MKIKGVAALKKNPIANGFYQTTQIY